ncbi:MAG: SemiSWEET transporter [Burkholderiaceae bacterium]
MSPALTEAIGYAAAALTTFSFAPQVVKSWKTRDLSGVSLAMYAFFTIGVATWAVYGVLVGSWPVVAANVVTLGLAGSVLVLKIRAR